MAFIVLISLIEQTNCKQSAENYLLSLFRKFEEVARKLTTEHYAERNPQTKVLAIIWRNFTFKEPGDGEKQSARL
jgi:hypothetical protein